MSAGALGSILSGSSSCDVNLPFPRPGVSTAGLPLWPQSAVAIECAAVACTAVAIECAAVVIEFSVLMDHMWHASLRDLSSHSVRSRPVGPRWRVPAGGYPLAGTRRRVPTRGYPPSLHLT